MKTSFLVLSLLVSSFASAAETELACWNIFGKGKSRPILTAKIENNKVLNLELNNKDKYFELYERVEKSYSNHWKSESTTTSRVFPEILEIAGEEITNSPTKYYNGNMEYKFVLGDFKYEAAWTETKQGFYNARLIIPKDLSSDFLKNFRIRKADERSNAVVVIPPAFMGGSDGGSYLRLYCTSK